MVDPDFDPKTHKQVDVISKNQLEFIIKQCNTYAKTLQLHPYCDLLGCDIKLNMNAMNQLSEKEGVMIA